MHDYVVLCGSLIHLPVSLINVQSEHQSVFGSLLFVMGQRLYMVDLKRLGILVTPLVIGYEGPLASLYRGLSVPVADLLVHGQGVGGDPGLMTIEYVLATEMVISTIMSLFFPLSWS